MNGDAVLGSVGTQIVADGKIAVRGIEGGPSVLTVHPGDTGVAITEGWRKLQQQCRSGITHSRG